MSAVKPILSLGHAIWKSHLQKGNLAIDATCGNGHDTLFLSQQSLSRLYVFDIQEKALSATKERVGLRSDISYLLGCHSLCEGVNEMVHLIIYNLGYLPGGDKSLTTRVETTLQSIRKGLSLLLPGGLMSLTLYTGHPEGKEEEEALLRLAKTLLPEKFQVTHHRLFGRSKAPSLLLIQKIV
ncbi:MAG: class I SAM-dependent methyltransferase [Chlamydiia bacterium]|nr:class I SAM-dependent methyltransferase [Chlamydiia bacterium]